MAESGSYDPAWRDLKRRIALFWAVWFLYLPVVVGSIKILDAWRPGTGQWAAPWIAVTCGAAWMASGFYRFSFRCPRCGGWYFSGDGWQNPIARQCLHCGLPRWSERTKQ